MGLRPPKKIQQRLFRQQRLPTRFEWDMCGPCGIPLLHVWIFFVTGALHGSSCSDSGGWTVVKLSRVMMRVQNEAVSPIHNCLVLPQLMKIFI